MKNKKAFKDCFFVYYSGKGNDHSEYSHPEVRVYLGQRYNGRRVTPEGLADFTGQNDRKNGFSIYQSYSLTCEFKANGYHLPMTMDLFKALGFGTKYENPSTILGLAKMLLKLGIERQMLIPCKEKSGQTWNQFIPARFRNSAQLWFEADQNGMKLDRAS